MRRIIPIWILLCLVPFLGIGQVSARIEPENFTLSGKPTETDIAFDVEIINTSGQAIYLLWSKRLNSGPADWLTWICCIHECFSPETSSCPENKFDTILPGDSTPIHLHLNPRGIEGTGEYVVNFIDKDGTPLGSATGNININLTSSINQVEKLEQLSIFPNPANDYFHTSNLPGLKDVEVFNILGNKIKSMDAAPQKQYYVGDLSEGIYLVRLIGSSNTILKTVRLSIE